MQKIQCELCQSTDILKEGEFFVCQHCGCKYSLEDARKMMTVTGTVKVDKSESLLGFLELARSASENNNNESALDYANKALEINPYDSEAWIIKAEAIANTATLGNQRISEIVEAGKNAIKFTEEEDRGSSEKAAYGLFVRHAYALIKTAQLKLSDTADIKNTFTTFSKISPLTAPQNTLQVDQPVIDLYTNAASEAKTLLGNIPDDAYAKHPWLAATLKDCADAYRGMWKALATRYGVYGVTITSEASNAQKGLADDFDEKATAMQNAAIKTCIEVDPETKANIESKQENIETIKRDIESLDKELSSLGTFKLMEKGRVSKALGFRRWDLSAAEKELKESIYEALVNSEYFMQ